MDLTDLATRLVAERVADRDGDIWWAVLAVSPSAKPRVYLQASGDAPLARVADLLSPSAMQFVLFRVLGVDTRGSVTSTRSKLVVASWVGPDVPRLRRSVALQAKTAVAQYFQGEPSTKVSRHLPTSAHPASSVVSPSPFSFHGWYVVQGTTSAWTCTTARR